jgi:hypothetical protein
MELPLAQRAEQAKEGWRARAERRDGELHVNGVGCPRGHGVRDPLARLA